MRKSKQVILTAVMLAAVAAAKAQNKQAGNEVKNPDSSPAADSTKSARRSGSGHGGTTQDYSSIPTRRRGGFGNTLHSFFFGHS